MTWEILQTVAERPDGRIAVVYEHDNPFRPIKGADVLRELHKRLGGKVVPMAGLRLITPAGATVFVFSINDPTFVGRWHGQHFDMVATYGGALLGTERTNTLIMPALLMREGMLVRL